MSDFEAFFEVMSSKIFIFVVVHFSNYRISWVCGVPNTLGKGCAECCTQQTTHDKVLSAKTSLPSGSICRVFKTLGKIFLSWTETRPKNSNLFWPFFMRYTTITIWTHNFPLCVRAFTTTLHFHTHPKCVLILHILTTIECKCMFQAQRELKLKSRHL